MTNFGIHTEMYIYSTKEDKSNKGIHIRLITNKQDPEVPLEIKNLTLSSQLHLQIIVHLEL